MKFTKNSKGDIIAISNYNGKTVKGVAKCSPDDTYNEELGKELAEARCNLAVNEKRLEGAMKHLNNIALEAQALQKKAQKAGEYAKEVMFDKENAEAALKAVLEKIN